MGCCLSSLKDSVKSFESVVDAHDKNSSSLIFSRSGILVNHLFALPGITDKDILLNDGTNKISSWVLNGPKPMELHSAWLISMLKPIRSDIDTICLLARLISIVELQDPLDGHTALRQTLYDAGAPEILSKILQHHSGSPEIIIHVIYILTHLTFNDGFSYDIVSQTLPQFLDLLQIIRTEKWKGDVNSALYSAIWRFIFVSSSDSVRVAEQWVDSNIGYQIVNYLSTQKLDEYTEGWGFAALRFLIKSNIETCKEYCNLGLVDLTLQKLKISSDSFLLESLLAILATVMITMEDYVINDPVVLKDIIKIAMDHVTEGSLIFYALIILIFACRRTNIYCHVITAADAHSLIHLINITHNDDIIYPDLIYMARNLEKYICTCCSNIGLVRVTKENPTISLPNDPSKFIKKKLGLNS
ncbi:hypothetical protein ACR3K2_34070 [Cryptosporidium serpentis]